MKRQFSLVASLILVVVMVFALASCETIKNYLPDFGGNDEHVHSFENGKCSCGETDPDYVPECAEHAYSSEVTTEATCEADGVKTFTCTVCGYSYEQAVPATGHNLEVVADSVQDPTCTEAGSQTEKCTKCDYSETKELAATGHTEEEIPMQAPTCTEPGLSPGKKCSVCGAVTTAQGTINPSGHKFVDGFCTNTGCQTIDPDYTGSRTYLFETNTVVIYNGDGTQNATDNAEIPASNYVYGYFTIGGTVTQRVKEGSVYCIELGKEDKGYIEFTVSGTASVEILFHSTSKSNTSWIGLKDADGNLVANNENVDRVVGTGDGLLVTYNLKAGTYRVVCPLVLEETGEVDEDGNPILKNPYSRTVRVYSVKVTDTPVEEISYEGAINVTTTDTYSWIDEYSFTAPVAGTYTFTIPAGFGIWSHSSWGNPELDPQLVREGGTVSFDLATGETLGFYVCGLTKGDAVFTWVWSETTQGGGEGGDDPIVSKPVDLVIGYNNINAENITYVYTADADGNLTLSAGNAVMGMVSISYSVNDGEFVVLDLGSSVELALVAGDTVVVAVEADGYSSLNAAWAGQSAGEEVVDLAIGNNSIEASNVNYSYVASEDGTLTLSAGGAVMGMVEISYSVNGGESVVLALNSSVDLALIAGDKVVVTVVAEGYSTLTAAWSNGQGGGDVEPDGSEENPFVWDTLPESVAVDYAVITGKVYYIFTATADGSVTFTWPVEGDSWYDIFELDENGYFTSNSTSGCMATSHSFVVEAGKSYRVSFGSWSEAGSHTITISFTSCAHEWSEATCQVLSTCANCGATTGDYADHIPNSENPTCADPAECTVCGAETGYVPHSFDDGVVTQQPDCSTETNGVKVLTCTVCGATQEEDIWAFHDWVVDEEVYATCTEDGHYKAHCSVCNKIDESTSEAWGHYNWYATCGETTTCMECGTEFTKNHEGSPATCTDPMYCYSCGQFIGDADPNAHDYFNGYCFICNAADPNYYFPVSVADAILLEDGAKVQLTGVVISADTWSTQYNNMSVTIKDANGDILYIFRLSTQVGLGDTITVTGAMATYNDNRQIGQGATAVIDVVHGDNHTYVDGACSVCGTKEPVVGETTVKCDFSTLSAGTQYADESNTFGEVTVSTHNKGCHFNTQLRIYDSASNDGWAIVTAGKTISGLKINMGYKVATLNVYGSVDGETWVLIEGVATTSTSYLDYTVNVDSAAGYKYLKLDASGAQIRVASIELSYQG